jgi:hypothetical protein
MKLKFTYLLLVAVIMASCGRKLKAPEIAGSGTSGLIGKWNLVSTNGTTLTNSEFDFFGTKNRIESNLTNTSSSPQGLYEITTNDLKATGIGYNTSGNLTVKLYEDDVLQSENAVPFPATPIGPYSQTTPYKLVGADSISFTSAVPVFVFQTVNGPATPPNGCKYKLEGNKLTLTSKYNYTSTDNSTGITITDKTEVDMTIILQKQ